MTIYKMDAFGDDGRQYAILPGVEKLRIAVDPFDLSRVLTVALSVHDICIYGINAKKNHEQCKGKPGEFALAE